MSKSAELDRLLNQSPWTAGLSPAERARVERDTIERAWPAGAVIFPKHAPALHWLGVIEGMAKADNVDADGRSTTFIGVSAGGWFGEGSVLKGEPRPYAVVALRDTRLALLPRETFEWLLGTHAQLAPIWRAYGIVVRPTKGGDVAHSDAFYVIDRNGDERAGFLSPFIPGLLTRDLRRLAVT